MAKPNQFTDAATAANTTTVLSDFAGEIPSPQFTDMLESFFGGYSKEQLSAELARVGREAERLVLDIARIKMNLERSEK